MSILAPYTGSVSSLGSNCLFGYSQIPCNYNLQNPSHFFTLGEALAAFGLIFAVYQLKNSSWDTVFRIRGFVQRNLFWFLGIIGLICIGFSAVMTQLPSSWLSRPFDYPVFYEILGFLAFVAAPLILFWLGKKKDGLFTPGRAERFYNVLLGEVAKSKPDSIENSVELIGYNLDSILDALQRNMKRSWWKRYFTEELSPEEKEIYGKYAYSLFNVILSDYRVSEYIANGRLYFILGLFEKLKEKGVASDVDTGIGKLFEVLFCDRRSHLYKQLDHGGITLIASLFEKLFEDPYVVARFNPFEGAQRWVAFEKLDEDYLKVFLKALEHTLEGYWKNDCPFGMVRPIQNAFGKLDEYYKILAYAANDPSKFDQSLARFNQIGFFFEHGYKWRYLDHVEKKDVTSMYELDVVNRNTFDKSVNATFAETIYNFLEGLSMIDGQDERVRLVALTSATEASSLRDQEPGMQKISQAVVDLVWGKINGDGLSNIRGFYPPILRLYISMIGLKVSDARTARDPERDRLINFLYDDLKPKILKDEKMSGGEITYEKGLLPDFVVFNRETGNFEYIMSGGSRQIMERTPVAEAVVVVAPNEEVPIDGPETD